MKQSDTHLIIGLLFLLLFTVTDNPIKWLWGGLAFIDLVASIVLRFGEKEGK